MAKRKVTKQADKAKAVELEDAELDKAAGGASPKLTEACADGKPIESSAHTGGVNAVFGDGSVRFVKDSI